MSIYCPRQKALQMVSVEEFSLMLECLMGGPDHRLPEKRWTWQRNRLVLLFLWGSGIRVSELVDLRYEDVEAGEIRVHHGKGNVGRTIGYPTDCDDDHRAWVELGLKAGRKPGDYMFTSYGPVGRWSRQQAYQVVRRAGRRAGISRPVGPHLLRHSMALSMLREGSDVVTIQRQLGHSNPAMTGIYLSGLDNESHVAAVRARVRERDHDAALAAERERASGPVVLNHLVQCEVFGY